MGEKSSKLANMSGIMIYNNKSSEMKGKKEVS